jgi:signal transduction histidine kinase
MIQRIETIHRAASFREGAIVVRASLLVIQGVDQGKRVEIGQDQVRIGRGAQNDLRILDTEVSRRHATILREQDGFVVRDDHSSNGTFVNGQPVRSRPLAGGDQVQVGRTVLLFSVDAPPGAGAPVSDQIKLLDQRLGGDRSQIIGEVDSKAGAELARLAAPGVPRDRSGFSLQVLYRISEEVVRPSSAINDVLQRILDLTLQAVGADRGCMLVADSRTDRIEPRVISRRDGMDAEERMPVSTSIVDYVIHHGQAVRTSDAQHDTRFEPGQSILQAGIREAMCVPIQGRYELLGVIYVDTTSQSRPLSTEVPHPYRFNDELLTLLLAIGRQSALAVENHRYQQALLTAERLAAVGQTIATLSHHIKNILQGIRGGSYLVDSGLKTDDGDLVRKGWGIVERNQGRIYNLVMDMLTFSKERRPELRSANLNQVVSEVCELMQGRADEFGINLELHPADELPQSLFDAEGIHRAVLNIVTNACDVLEESSGGRVTVSTGYDPQQEEMFVEVSDNGPGIPEAELPRLFSLFESTKGARGTGLGLAVSQKILQEHDGEITVDSQAGVGTRFRLTWPLLDEARLHADSAEFDVVRD